MKRHSIIIAVVVIGLLALLAERSLSDATLLIKGRRENDFVRLVDTAVPSESLMWTTNGIRQFASGFAVDSDDGENGILYIAAENIISHRDLSTGANIGDPIAIAGYTFIWGLEYIESEGEGKLFGIARRDSVIDPRACLLEFSLAANGIVTGLKKATPMKEPNGDASYALHAGLAWHSGRNTLYTTYQANVLQPLGFDGQLGAGEANMSGNGIWGLAYQDGELYGHGEGSQALCRFDLDEPNPSNRVVWLATNPPFIWGNALSGTTTPPAPVMPIMFTGSFPDGDVDIHYEEPVEAFGGAKPYSWTVTGGSLPNGLSIGWTTPIHDGNIVITGTPTTVGVYEFSLRVTDNNSNYDETHFTMTIHQFKITTETLKAPYKDFTYSCILQAVGGQAPLLWTVQIGHLPNGLSINSGTGEIYGTPTTLESQTFTIRVTDALAKQTEKEFTMQVTEAPPLVLLYGGVSDPGNIYSINATNPDLWSETHLFSTPGVRPIGSATDSENGVIYVSDFEAKLSKWNIADGSMLWSNQKFSINHEGTPYWSCFGLEFVNDTLYGVGIRSGTGGDASYLFTIDIESNIGNTTEIGRLGPFLAAGLAFVPETGCFYTAEGAWVLYKADPNSPGPDIATRIGTSGKYRMHGLAYQNSQVGTGEKGKLFGVNGGEERPVGAIYQIDWETGFQHDPVGISSARTTLTGQTSPSPMAVPPQELPNVSRGAPYWAQIILKGGTGPFAWNITDGALPVGLMLNPSTGEITGTTSALPGSYDILVYVQDSAGNEDDQWLSVPVAAEPVEIVTVSVHNGKVGSYQNTVFEAVSGDGPRTWSHSGAVPPGLGFSQVADTYVLSGTPTTEGQYLFTVTVTDNLYSQTYGYNVEIKDYSPWTLIADDPCLFSYIGSSTQPIGLTPMERWLGACTAANGKIYVAGGGSWLFDDGGLLYGGIIQSAFSIYDPATDKWDAAFWRKWPQTSKYPVNGQPTGYNNGNGTNKPIREQGTGYCQGQACAYDVDADGTEEIYLFGGYPRWDGSGSIYDPDTNAWRLTSLPSSDGLAISGFRRGAVAGNGEKMYLIGGAGNISLFAIIEYDADTDRWMQLTDSPAGWENHSAARVGQKIFVFGGTTNFTAVYSYDIPSDTWSGPLAPIPTGVWRAAAVADGTRILLVGGTFTADTLSNLIQVYDTISNTWSNLPAALPFPVTGVAAAKVGSDLIVADGNLSASSEVFTNRVFKTPLAGGPPSPIITNVARTASLTITWNSVPGATYRVESSVSPYDYVESNMTWTNEVTGLASGGTSTSWTDVAAVGEKYYRVYTEDASGDLKADDTVGQMTILAKTGRNLMSSMFEPYPAGGGAPGASTLDKIVGNQLTGHSLNKFLSDNIELWVNASGAYKRAWYKTGTTNAWQDWDIAGPPAFGMDADKGYWFNIISGHVQKNVMFCGRVSKASRSIPIAIGRNLVGSSFPVSCTLAKSGLVASGFTGHNLNKFLSDNVEFWKNPGAIYERFWYKTGTTNAWQPWNVGDPMRDIAAGDSIWVNVLNTHAAFTWTYPVPPRP